MTRRPRDGADDAFLTIVLDARKPDDGVRTVSLTTAGPAEASQNPRPAERSATLLRAITLVTDVRISVGR